MPGGSDARGTGRSGGPAGAVRERTERTSRRPTPIAPRRSRRVRHRTGIPSCVGRAPSTPAPSTHALDPFDIPTRDAEGSATNLVPVGRRDRARARRIGVTPRRARRRTRVRKKAASAALASGPGPIALLAAVQTLVPGLRHRSLSPARVVDVKPPLPADTCPDRGDRADVRSLAPGGDDALHRAGCGDGAAGVRGVRALTGGWNLELLTIGPAGDTSPVLVWH